MNLDEIDKKIVRALKEQADLTIAQLSRKVALPLTTVHNRIKKLKQEKVIKNYTINIDYKKLGKEIAAYIFITVDYKMLQEQDLSQFQLANQLKKYPAVEEVSMITGSQDIIIKVRVSNVEELNAFITQDLRNIEGIEKTQTHLILQETS